MSRAKILHTTLLLLVYMPMSLTLSYKLLASVEATDFMWFLYWANIPVLLVITILAAVVGDD